MTATAEFLKASPYFAGMSITELESIAGLFYQKTVNKGENIVWEGDPGEALYFVISGAVKCFKLSKEGKEQILQIVLPGGSFNDVAVFDGGPSPTSTEAMSLVNLYVIAARDMHQLIDNYPKLIPNVTGVLTGQIRHLLNLVDDLSFRQVISRIAKILLEHADGAGPKPKLTQQDMAALAGTVREVVGRSLKTLQEEGLIRMERNRLVISDKTGLSKVAGSPA
ncbi:MAG: Crp/Fnr family transcriptional regulator [Dehalococcoidia bacterium]